jgi:plastocyanin
MVSGGFSSGAMQAGSSSQSITVDRAGTYLFGCFFHYGAPMRGAIVAQ